MAVTLDYRDPETGQSHTESKTAQILVELNYFLMWLQFIALFILAAFAAIVCYFGYKRYLGWRHKPEIIRDLEEDISFS